jgi:hypothetical protein
MNCEPAVIFIKASVVCCNVQASSVSTSLSHHVHTVVQEPQVSPYAILFMSSAAIISTGVQLYPTWNCITKDITNHQKKVRGGRRAFARRPPRKASPPAVRFLGGRRGVSVHATLSLFA